MIKFKDTYNKEIDRLKQFIPIVSRVHGKTHNEFYEVEEVFNEILLLLGLCIAGGV